MGTSEHTYRCCPSLRKHGNDILLLLIWSTMFHGRSLEAMQDWAALGDASSLYQQLQEEFQNFQELEQLALILAALLTHARLLPYTVNDTTQSINGCFLADLDIVLRGKSLNNRREVLERVGFSLRRVLDVLPNDHGETSTFMGTAIDKNPPLLDFFDGLTDQYLVTKDREETPSRERVRRGEDSSFDEDGATNQR